MLGQQPSSQAIHKIWKRFQLQKKPRVGPKNGSLSCCEGKPWWKVYDKSLEHSPLEMWWVTDEKKKIKMDGKKLCIQVLPPRRCCEQIFGTKCPPRRLSNLQLWKLVQWKPSSKRSKTKKGLKQWKLCFVCLWWVWTSLDVGEVMHNSIQTWQQAAVEKKKWAICRTKINNWSQTQTSRFKISR